MNYSEYLEEQKKRKGEIVNLRKSGKTYQEIGDLFGLSRQRIHQILNNNKIYCTYKLLDDDNWLKETVNFTNSELSELTGVDIKLVSRKRSGIRHKCAHIGVWAKGILAEEWASQYLQDNGIDNQLKNFRADYDILALGNVRIDVKSSNPLSNPNTINPQYVFSYNNKQDVDLYFCVLWDTKDVFIFPSDIMRKVKSSKRFVWPSNSDKINKHNSQYHNRLDLIWEVHNRKLQEQDAN